MIHHFQPFLSKQGIRVIQLHGLLRNRGKYSSTELMEYIKEGEGASNGSYSTRSFREDIQFLKEVLDAPLKITNRGVYYYERKFSIFPKVGLIDEDLDILENLASAAGKYNDLPFFRDLSLLIDKLDPEHKKQEIIGFEGAPVAFGGIEHFEDVFWSIQQNRQLDIEYHQFGKEAITIRVHPYYLKEHAHRWYLIAWNPFVSDYRTYALDRIALIEEHEENSFIQREDFNPSTHWQYSVGIMAVKTDPELFSFEVKDGNIYGNKDYIRSLSIHASQKITELNDGYMRVELMVNPTIELFRIIRSYGQHNVRSISPERYANEIWEG